MLVALIILAVFLVLAGWLIFSVTKCLSELDSEFSDPTDT